MRQLVAEEVDQLDQVGRAKLEVQEAALDFFRNGAHRRTDDDELPLVATALIEIAQAAADQAAAEAQQAETAAKLQAALDSLAAARL